MEDVTRGPKSLGAEQGSSVSTAVSMMLGETPPEFDLACVGTSLYGLGALSFQAVTCLTAAEIVFCYPLTGRMFDVLKLLNDNIINVNETHYVRGRAFEPTYSTIITEVMQTLKTGKKVAYATQGSPGFYCSTCVSLYRQAKQEGFKAVMVGGVSSLEMLTPIVAERHNLRNLQLYTIPDVMNGVVINHSVPCFLFNLARHVLPAVREPATELLQPKLAEVADLMRTTYPADHEVLLLWLRSDGARLQLRTTPRELDRAVMEFAARFGAVPTIFVPAVPSPR